MTTAPEPSPSGAFHTLLRFPVYRFIFICLAWLWLNPGWVHPQAGQKVFLDDWSYALLNYWVDNGTFSPRFVLNQPFTLAEVEGNLQQEGPWRRHLREYYRRTYGTSGLGHLALYARDTYALVSDEDMPLRPGRRTAPIDDVALFDNRSQNHYALAGQLSARLPHLTLHHRTVVNSEFRDDPLYPGDNSQSLSGRINDAFVATDWGGFELFVGRVARNWGPAGSASLILSNNPYTYDQLHFAYSHRRFRLSMLVSRLEDTFGQDFEGTAPDSLVSARRFMSAHRLDVRLSPRLALALTEVAIYGGPGRGFEFGFLNPLNFFYLVQRNNQQQINGLWALDVFYKPATTVSLTAQFLLDDFIVNNVAGQDDRARHPDRLGLHLRASAGDLWLAGLHTELSYVRIGNRTYQSFRTWENFHYRGKGLGYPQASVERLQMTASYFGNYPNIWRLRFAYQRSGDAQLTDVFTGAKDARFPVGVVERSLRLEVELRRLLNAWAQITVRAGFEQVTNLGHVRAEDHPNLMLLLGVRVHHGLRVKLD